MYKQYKLLNRLQIFETNSIASVEKSLSVDEVEGNVVVVCIKIFYYWESVL